MAWVQVGSGVVNGSPTTWGRGPAISVQVNFVTYRDDVTNSARIGLNFIVDAVSGASSFGYNIVAGGWAVDGSTYKSTIVKNNSPSQWSSALYGWLEWEIGNVDPNTAISIGAAFTSNSGRAEIDFGDSFTIPRLEVESGRVYVGAGDAWKQAVPYVGVNGEWKKAAAHIGVGGAWKKTE